MAEATVIATHLNMRDAPEGAVVSVLENGASVSVLDTQGSWLRVSTTSDGQTRLGWVSAQFVRIASASAPAAGGGSTVPPPDDAAHPVTVQDGKAIGPDGRIFAHSFKLGFFTLGSTSLVDWLAANPTPAGITPSMVSTVRVTSLNEGKLEAINSYDNAFLSFGMLQWTAGTGDDPGELAAFLGLVKNTDPSAFQTYFGRYGLDVRVSSATSPTGVLVVNGTALNRAALKEQLRAAPWCYRLWRAGNDDLVRRCELVHAAARIERFHQKPVAGLTVADWLSSEYGIALVLDEHVNRPGHVPGTLETAIGNLAGNPDPTNWTDAQEGELIDLYIDARNDTNMTNPQLRAANITRCVHDGTLSAKRGSFVTAGAATGV
jgi:hypothetical protein